MEGRELRSVEIGGFGSFEHTDRAIRTSVVGNTSLTSLEVWDPAFTCERAENRWDPLLESLVTFSTSLCRLSLNSCIVGKQGSLALQELLRITSSLQILTLNGCTLSVDEPDKMAEELMLAPHLKELHLGQTDMGLARKMTARCGDDVETPLPAMTQNSTLVVLDLSKEQPPTHENVLLDMAFLRSIDRFSALRFLNLRGLYVFGRANWEEIGRSFFRDTFTKMLSLETLILADNDLDDDDVSFLAEEALANNTVLLHLDISNNEIYCDGATSLTHMLCTNSCLRSLNINACQIADSCAANLIRGALRMNSTLQCLYLDAPETKIDDYDEQGYMYMLTEAISVTLVHGCNTTLQTLSLRNRSCTSDRDYDSENDDESYESDLENEDDLDNDDDDDDDDDADHDGETEEYEAIDSIAYCLANNSSLVHLDLSHASLTDGDARPLAKSLARNCTLQYLDLSGNSFGGKSMWRLCEGLASNTCLFVLNLEHQVRSHRKTCTSAACDAAISFLICNNTTLQYLKIGHEKASVHAFQALEHNSTIRHLSWMSECSDSALIAMANTLRHNTALTNLHIHKQITTSSARNAFSAVLEALRERPRYYGLHLTGFYTPPIVTEAPKLAPERCCDSRHPGKILEYINRLHFDKMLAFAMGQHARLGAQFQGQGLVDDNLQMIMMYYFGLPLDYLHTPHTDEFKYVDVVKAAGFQSI